MDHTRTQNEPLLGPDDPAPVTVVNGDGSASAILICDHASNAVPASLHGLGLIERDLHRHIAHDIGAAAVTRLMAEKLDAPAVLAGYSRLVIDTNRRLDHPESINVESDGTTIPANQDITPEDVRRRTEECFWPFHRKIGAGIAGFALRGIRPAVIAIHGFTPVFGGFRRPWHVGVLWNEDGRLAVPLIDALRTHQDLVIGDNEPYSGRQQYGYSIDTHAGETGLPNVLVELREDLAATPEAQEKTADLLVDALRPILSGLGLACGKGD
jgi:predicted N-formylglutamate amidohydrolase